MHPQTPYKPLVHPGHVEFYHCPTWVVSLHKFVYHCPNGLSEFCPQARFLVEICIVTLFMVSTDITCNE